VALEYLSAWSKGRREVHVSPISEKYLRKILGAVLARDSDIPSFLILPPFRYGFPGDLLH